MTPSLHITKSALCALFWIVLPALSYAEEEGSLAQALSDLNQKATGSWIRYDGGVFIAGTEYNAFRVDVNNQSLVVDQYEITALKSTGQVIATRRRRLTIRLASLDPELIDVTSQKSFVNSSVKVFFVSLISSDEETAITFEGTEKRGDKPERTISGAWPECYLVFQDQDCAEGLRQALVHAIKQSGGKKG
jgi:hypothetical protein